MRTVIVEMETLDKIEDLVWKNKITTEKYLKLMQIMDQKEKRLRIMLQHQALSMRANTRVLKQIA